MFAGPSFVGDRTFAAKVESLGSRVQRFEYQMDAVTMVPPGLGTAVGPKIASLLGEGCTSGCEYKKSGQRNWYQSETKYYYNYESERDISRGDIATANSLCEHNPNWYVRAAYNQLSSTERDNVPDRAPKTDLAGCNPDGAPILPELVKILWTAGNIAGNVVGTALDPGQYKISCHAFKNHPKRYLHWDGKVGSQLTVSKSPTIFNIKYKAPGPLQPPGGYQFWKGEGNMAADVHFPNLGGKDAENSNNILMTRKDSTIGDEETWYLLRVQNTGNAYVLYNWNTHQVLDAPNACLQSNGDCKVNEFSPKSDEPTQVWILEKQ